MRASFTPTRLATAEKHARSVECTVAKLVRFRGLGIRYQWHLDIHFACLILGGTLVCFRVLQLEFRTAH